MPRWKQPYKRDIDAQRVRELLTQYRMTSREIEVELGMIQQDVSKALHAIGAQVVGSRRPYPPRAGRGCNTPMPEYALAHGLPTKTAEAPQPHAAQSLEMVTAVWAMTGRNQLHGT